MKKFTHVEYLQSFFFVLLESNLLYKYCTTADEKTSFRMIFGLRVLQFFWDCANSSCFAAGAPHIFAGRETDTYTWDRQDSPEICFCTGANRVFSLGICDRKTSPDRRDCPVPRLMENGRRYAQTHTHTHSGVQEHKRGLQDKALTWCTASEFYRLGKHIK